MRVPPGTAVPPGIGVAGTAAHRRSRRETWARKPRYDAVEDESDGFAGGCQKAAQRLELFDERAGGRLW
jgi:hypothetical protein